MGTFTTTPAESISHPASGGALTRAIDRWIYVIMAASYIVYALVGFILVPTMYHQVWNGMQAAPPPVAAEMQDRLRNFDNIMLIQTRIGILFPIFLAIALLARRTDAGLHKRMMLLSIAPALPAAFDRMTWLPTTLPASPLAPDLYTIAAIAPMLLWDLYRTRTLHKAYVIWFSLFIAAGVVVHLLWNTEWWHATAPKLVGL